MDDIEPVTAVVAVVVTVKVEGTVVVAHATILKGVPGNKAGHESLGRV